MSFSDKQKQTLAAPLNGGNVKTRKNYGGGGDLSYIESWFAIQEANRIFGFDGWSSETVQIERIATTPYSKNGKEMVAVSYMARVRVTVGDVTREGCGYGDGQGQTDKAGAAHELALKEAESDARKRALMTFGNPFGLALYDKKKSNVESANQAQKRATDSARRSKADSRDDYARLEKAIRDTPDMASLAELWKAEWPLIQTLDVGSEDSITVEKDDRKNDFNKQSAA